MLCSRSARGAVRIFSWYRSMIRSVVEDWTSAFIYMYVCVRVGVVWEVGLYGFEHHDTHTHIYM